MNKRTSMTITLSPKEAILQKLLYEDKGYEVGMTEVGMPNVMNKGKSTYYFTLIEGAKNVRPFTISLSPSDARWIAEHYLDMGLSVSMTQALPPSDIRYGWGKYYYSFSGSLSHHAEIIDSSDRFLSCVA